MPNTFSGISKDTVQRYSGRYKNLGYHIRTLGWGTVKQQRCRFFQTLRAGVDFEGKAVVDIGCGFGDYADYLAENGIAIISYTGLDINTDLIEEAQRQNSGHIDCSFKVLDLCNEEFSEKPLGEIGIMLGVLNYNLKDKLDNYEYTKRIIGNALSLVSEVLIVDFLSAHRYEGYPHEDFVFYHEPSRMLDFALGLSDNVALLHDYLPIPQKEFMLVIRKKNHGSL